MKSKNLFDVESISNSVQRLAIYRTWALISIGRLCTTFIFILFTEEPNKVAAAQQSKVKGAVKPAPVPAESASSKAQGKKAALTAAEVMKSKSLDDSAKFEVFKSMVTEGKISNKEVVNSVLHLVRTVHQDS